MLGFATGCVGMSRDDFERCTPSEFAEAARQFSERVESRYRTGWEQTRTLVVSVANFFSEHPLEARSAFPLPWDQETKTATPKGSSSYERMKELEKGTQKR